MNSNRLQNKPRTTDILFCRNVRRQFYLQLKYIAEIAVWILFDHLHCSVAILLLQNFEALSSF